MNGSPTRQTEVELDEQDQVRLAEIVRLTGLSENDAVRKAIATEQFVQDALRSGGRMFVENDSGTLRIVEFDG